MSQFDAFLADSSRIGSEIRAAKAQADDAELALRRAQKANKLIADLEQSNAGNLAMKYLALRELKRLDPTHPLVRDAALREQVSAAAKKVLKVSGNWDDVRDFGQNYKLPGR
ncbi:MULTISPECIES: hypothetical protein [unclassified Variovorax]|uniref:hypothetical protein n=1 Tax=unclassified Variovorax TaxID=663243 RepID=UPI00076CF168|nr:MULTISPECIES: hypothetical protein [unclassified Variovorax]KWT65019.1 hypothetical protein APY03_7472 [Variovorax sp. WDL1]PNG49113.1 hypothetical protein CHC06_06350 [Variovorax sp. B2]PNG49498.1 hypothetical protein CHC07_06407 [Variovorax sp. B4]VTV18869.1 hypothetical protein WDL1P2_00490 [Variovorax sp. WDL1]